MLRVIVILIFALFIGSCKKDPCKDVTCEHGTCNDGSCLCETGYEGSNCETEQRLAFVGNYNVTETCGPNSYNFTINILADTENVNELSIHNFGDLNFNITATVDGTSISIVDQSGNGKTVNGSGELVDGVLSISYTLETTSGQSIDCTLTGTLE